MNQVFNDLYNVIWKNVLPEIEVLDIEKFRELFTKDLLLPAKYQCSINGEDVYGLPEYNYKRFIGDTERTKRMNEGNGLQPKRPLDKLYDVLAAVRDVAYFRGSKSLNSEVIEASDNIYSSSYIYNSAFIHGSTKLMFCRDMGPNEYMLASKNSKNCSFGIRVLDCDSVSSSFEVSFAAKCSNSFFCHNCFDLRDCMFCFDINSKQYCIANIQLEEAEYKTLKQNLLTEYFSQLGLPGGFKTLSDIGQ